MPAGAGKSKPRSRRATLRGVARKRRERAAAAPTDDDDDFEVEQEEQEEEVEETGEVEELEVVQVDLEARMWELSDSGMRRKLVYIENACASEASTRRRRRCCAGSRPSSRWQTWQAQLSLRWCTRTLLHCPCCEL